jgi:hypothetical protein
MANGKSDGVVIRKAAMHGSKKIYYRHCRFYKPTIPFVSR